MKLTCCAYADDMILFAKTAVDAQLMLDAVVHMLGSHGMLLSPQKCRSLLLRMVPSKKKLFVDNIHQFNINSILIPCVGVGEMFTYLGEEVNDEGVSRGKLSLQLFEHLQKVIRAPLKPQQKMKMMSKYLIPKYISRAQKQSISGKVLEEMDRKIRVFVKKVLHMPPGSSTAIFYTPLKAGGLGIFSFRQNIPRIMLQRIEKVRRMDEVLEEVLHDNVLWIGNLRRLLRPHEVTKNLLTECNSNTLEGSWYAGGGGLYTMKVHKMCTDVFRNVPRYWSGKDYIRAIHLRFNLLPVKSMPSVAFNQRQCRGCHHYNESLSHVISKCEKVIDKVTERHNFVQKRLVDAAKKSKWSVFQNMYIRGTTSTYFPDLIMVKDDQVIVSDISVDWESNGGLATWYARKQQKYSTPDFIEAMKRKLMLEHHNIRVLPFVVGARGGWIGLNDFLTTAIQMTSNNIKDVITTVMRGSIYIYESFMRRIWATTGPEHQISRNADQQF